MTQRFRVSIQRVVCHGEQLREWGKDEMRLLGFGCDRQGRIFSTGYRTLGSFGSGDVRQGAVLGPPLIDAELPDDELEVLLFLWLVEEDGGGVRDSAGAIQAEMRERFQAEAARLAQTAYPRDFIPFTAFYKTVIPMTARIELAGRKGRDDRVFPPADIVIGRVTDGVVVAPIVTGETSFTKAARGGLYDVFLQFRYEAEPVIVG